MSAASVARRPRTALLLAALLLAFVGLAATAMLRNSATFDEIIFPADGARGYQLGDFGLILDHPPVMQYVYGLPVWLMRPNYPPEEGRNWDFLSRYEYARAFLWGFRNVPERIIAASRLVAVLIGALLVWSTYMLNRARLGAGTALVAATLVAFLPDVLGHSGVTYNDVPVTLALLAAVYAADRAVRSPGVGTAALAGLLSALAIGVKLSALVVLPILALLVVLEAAGRWRDRAWRAGIAKGAVIYVLVVYAALVAIYLGDLRLARFFETLHATLRLDSAAREAMLFGAHSRSGFWYFFPVVFLLKTPAALHALVLVALAGAWLAAKGRRAAELASHPLRAPWVALLVIVAGLVASKIDIGFRHAMPALPFACVLVAAGVARVWGLGRPALRALVAALVVADVLSVVLAYPYFLSYLSEYVRGRPLYETLVDSSTDWGQGLLALREFMRERGIGQVYLAYFGSALPEGYGIAYATKPSFFPLPDFPADAASPPRYIAVSATLLAGLYLKADPYAALRRQRPVAIVGGTIYVYEWAH